jgi:hypothetical protein
VYRRRLDEQGRERLQKHVLPDSRVRRTASRFINATISTWSFSWSWTTAVTRPFASYFRLSRKASIAKSALLSVLLVHDSAWGYRLQRYARPYSPVPQRQTGLTGAGI